MHNQSLVNSPIGIRRQRHLLAMVLLGAFAINPAGAQQGTPPAPIIVSGSVPDEPSHVALITKVREVFGRDRVVDNLTVGGVVAPPNWSAHAATVVTPDLKSISQGQISMNGTNLTISGQVASEAVRQQIASNLASSLTPSYVVKNGLQVAAPQQNLLDKVLADRTVEFESGSARLTANGTMIVDEIAAAMKALGNRDFQVVGHTDDQGSRNLNVSLSLARANAVRAHLTAKGIDPARIATRGEGPDFPLATNATEAGRARNRRIEFRVN